MPIDREKLYTDVMFWFSKLPNQLSEQDIRAQMELVIASVGDDEANYPEIFCNTLRQLAIANDSITTVNSASIKRERVGRIAEIEYYEGGNTKGVWDKFLERLKDICPMYGYVPPRAFGIKIHPGKKIKKPGSDCGCP